MGRLKWNWGVGIVAAYAAFAASTLGFVAFAMTQPVDLVSADYYALSLRHDERLRAEAGTRALGPAFVCEAGDDGRSVNLKLPVEHRTRARGTILLYRPSDSRADRVVTLLVNAEGRQRVPLAAAGRWIVKVQWDVQDQSFYHEQTVVAR
ncbi:MAG TPA: FixH family protein [Vicinamibacterales bacterium]|nr:FixH family protein [Vicinamibacterales bacterium]